jgi:hypothetical protein
MGATSGAGTAYLSGKPVEVEWTSGPVKEYKLLDPASSSQDIHNLHRGGTQIPTGHLVQ